MSPRCPSSPPRQARHQCLGLHQRHRRLRRRGGEDPRLEDPADSDPDRPYPRRRSSSPPGTGRDGGTDPGDDAVTPPPEVDSGCRRLGVRLPPTRVPPAGGCFSEAWTRRQPRRSQGRLLRRASGSPRASTCSSAGFPSATPSSMRRRAIRPLGLHDSSSWGVLMESVDTMCHEETHGWDFDTALSLSGKHAYHMRVDLVIKPPKFSDFFARNELLSYITDSATSLYDGTYLKGEQGTYDFIFLGDELTAYTNAWLACVAALGDQIGRTAPRIVTARRHILYLEWYLNRARTAHPTV